MQKIRTTVSDWLGRITRKGEHHHASYGRVSSRQLRAGK